MTVKTSRFCHSYLYMYLFRTHYLFNLGNIFIVIYLVLMYSILSSYVYLHVLIYLCMICMSLLGCWAQVTLFYHRGWNRLFQRIQQPISKKEEERREWQQRGGVCGKLFVLADVHRPKYAQVCRPGSSLLLQGYLCIFLSFFSSWCMQEQLLFWLFYSKHSSELSSLLTALVEIISLPY